MMQRHGAWHFVGVNGCLHVHLGACTRFAKTKHGNSAAGAGCHAGQLDTSFFDGHGNPLLQRK